VFEEKPSYSFFWGPDFSEEEGLVLWQSKWFHRENTPEEVKQAGFSRDGEDSQASPDSTSSQILTIPVPNNQLEGLQPT
jgi:hypothetical protein